MMMCKKLSHIPKIFHLTLSTENTGKSGELWFNKDGMNGNDLHTFIKFSKIFITKRHHLLNDVM